MSYKNRYLVLAILSSVITLFCFARYLSGYGWLLYLIGTVIFFIVSSAFWYLTHFFWNAQLPSAYILEISKTQFCSKCGSPLLVKIESFSMERAPLPVIVTYYCPHFLGEDHTSDMTVNLEEMALINAAHAAAHGTNSNTV